MRRVQRPGLERCGLMTSADLVHFTNGSTAAMTLSFIVASRPGDLVVTEALGHHTLKPLMHYLGLRLAGLDIDAEGIVPESLERMCSQESVKVLFLLPSGLNPACTTMSESRRASLVDLARKHDVLIIENDAWGPLQPDRPPPIAGLGAGANLLFHRFQQMSDAGFADRLSRCAGAVHCRNRQQVAGNGMDGNAFDGPYRRALDHWTEQRSRCLTGKGGCSRSATDWQRISLPGLM